MNFNKMFMQEIAVRGNREHRTSAADTYMHQQHDEEDSSSCYDCHTDQSTSSLHFYDAGEFCQSQQHIDYRNSMGAFELDELTRLGISAGFYDRDEDDPTNRLISVIHSLRDTVQENTATQQERTETRHSGGGGGGGRQHHHHRKGTGEPGKENDNKAKKKMEKVNVEIRVVFLKIGEIDTLKEVYHAEAFIQAKWREPKLDNRTNEEIQQHDLEKLWSPLIFIDNILNESKDHCTLTAHLNEKSEAVLVERRRVKGVFLETLELNDFPLDVQDLTITITSERPDTEIDLVPDIQEVSGINLATFVDQQEWRLHQHIEITKTSVTQEFTSSSRSHPCLSVTCRAARRPGYFYWNVFLIMFFITGLSFATFSLPPDRPENRLQLSFTLFLTSVAFKFVINQSLPKISYLTYMDKYVLMSLAILCIVSVWHALVTLIPPNWTPKDSAKPDLTADTHFHEDVDLFLASSVEKASNWVKKIERDVFVSFCVLYILAHLFFIFWLYFDASKRRREMIERDKQYRNEKNTSVV